MNLDDIRSQLLSLIAQAKLGFVDALPNLVTAVIVLVGGWWLAWSLRKLVRRVFRGLATRMPAGTTRAAWTEAVDDRNAGNAAANGVYWLVLLTALMVSIDALGVPVFSKWLGALAGYLPRVVVAMGLVFGGIVGGRVARNAVIRTARRLSPTQA
jgi:putative Mn2+ efflux pump MntP